MTEAIVSIFLLSSVVIMVMTMLNASLRYQGQAQRRAMAAMLGRKTFEQVRAWAWESPGGALNFSGDWAAYDGASLTDPDHPDYTIEVNARPGTATLYSPCSSLESGYGSRARRLDASLVPVSVKVRWQEGSTPQELEMVSFVGEPPRQISSVLVTRVHGPSDPVPREGVVEFSAQALDGAGQPLPDVMFRWYVEPTAPNSGDDPGLGTLLPPWGPPVVPPLPETPRHGRRASLKHSYIRSDGVTWGYSEGFCRVIAVAISRGQEVRGQQIVRLAP
jgi:hypothetical protein